MHLGVFLHCEHREGETDQQALQEAFAVAANAEKDGMDGVWLAELHFAGPEGGGTGRTPSVAAAPMVLAGAIAARTARIRIGIAVTLLPLAHPVRLAEEVATVDHISQGRLDFGAGRSAFPIAYAGYGVPYEESRERFDECLEILLRAWTQERFSYSGRFHDFKDVAVVPRPFQQPHPPIRVAASTEETFRIMGERGYPIFVRVGSSQVEEVARELDLYRESWRKAGHPGEGDPYLSIPVYVAATERAAYEEPQASTVGYYRGLAERFARSAAHAGATPSEQRAERAGSLSSSDYDQMLKERLAYGTPDAVAERLRALRDRLGLTGVLLEPNIGGRIPRDRVAHSLHLFATAVAPSLR